MLLKRVFKHTLRSLTIYICITTSKEKSA